MSEDNYEKIPSGLDSELRALAGAVRQHFGISEREFDFWEEIASEVFPDVMGDALNRCVLPVLTEANKDTLPESVL